MSQALRDTIRERQSELLRTLVQRQPIPPGFHEANVRESAASLGRKRERSVIVTCPRLVESLGERFRGLFEEFANSNGIPAFGGPVADGRSFARFVASREPLDAAAKLEMLGIDLRFEACAGGLQPRRGSFFGFATLGWLRHFAIAVRLPWIGERWWIV